MKPVQIVCRTLIAASVITFAGASSCDGGEVANTATCPVDETCNSATQGVEFRGAIGGEEYINLDTGVKPLAMGGTQLVRLFDYQTGRTFNRLFDAVLDANLGSASSAVGNQFTLHANATANGEGYLRIIDRATGTLDDRLKITILPVTGVRARQTFGDSMARLPLTDAAWVAPGGVVYVELTTATTTAVDESMQIVGNGTQTKWDRFVVGNPAPGTMQLTVSRGVQPAYPLTLKVVAGPDAINDIVSLKPQVNRNVEQLICFGALKQNHVVHVPWRFETNNGTIEPVALDGCVSVRPDTVGALALTVHAGTLTKTFTSNVVAANSRARQDARAELHAALARRAMVWSDDRGERATLQP